MVSKQHSPTKAWVSSKCPSHVTVPVAPQAIIDKLVTSKSRGGTISNSDLELAGGLLQLEALAHTFDICECTVLSKGGNLSTTTDSAPPEEWSPW